MIPRPGRAPISSASVLVLAALLVTASSAVPVFAVEPWADGRLPQTSGLMLWLDASRQSAARGALGLSPLQSWHDRIDYLFDGSGLRNDLVQPLAESRPAFEQWNSAILHFDGTNDFLSFESINLAARD